MGPKESFDMAFDQGRRAALPNSPFRLAKKTRKDCPYLKELHAVEIDGVYIRTKPVWWKGWMAGWNSVTGASNA